MGTTLTKPVLLDETGQEIVDKLDEIKTAIGSTGEFIPVMIKVTTPPTKTTYGAGEALDLTGMVVTLYASNGMTFDVTGDCTFSPANGATLTSQNTSVDISYTWYETQTTFTTVQNLNIRTLTSIAVTTPPTLTEYYEGETLDLTGIVVTATFDNGSTQAVTSDCIFSPANGATLTTNDNLINISYTMSGVTKTTTQTITINVETYGVEWDGTADPTMERTDLAENFVEPVPFYTGMSGNPSSPFDEVLPWSGMERIQDSNAGVLVKIPKFYYKLSTDEGKFKLQISAKAQAGFYTSPAHADRGDGSGERDYVYVGAYHCSSSNYKSLSGATPKASITRETARTNIHNLGTEIYQWDKALLTTIQMLYLVEFASWDSQEKIGYGCSDAGSVQSSGITDSFNYHTGTNATSRQSYGHVKYRWIEDLWGNVHDWLDGVYAISDEYYCIKNPNYFSDSQYGEDMGLVASNSEWVPTSMVASNVSGYEWFFVPSTNTATPGTWTTYITDMSSGGSFGRTCVYVGAGSLQKKYTGLFFVYRLNTSSTADNVGCRLMKLPTNT